MGEATGSDDILALVERYCTPGLSLTKEELDDAYRIVVAVQHVAQERFRRMLTRHSDTPLLVAYMNDGWTADVCETAVDNAGTDVRLRNEGRRRQEFLGERALIRCRNARTPEDLVFMCGVPRALIWGKSHECLFAAACDFMSPPRLLDHAGPLVTVYIFDGNPVNGAQGRLLVGRHELVYNRESGYLGDSDDRDDLRDSELVIRMTCKTHAANLAVDWGLRLWGAPDVVDAAFIAISSVLKPSANIFSTCRAFMLRHVRPRSHVEDPRAVRAYWSSLSIPLGMLDLFQEVDPQWDPAEKALYVNAAVLLHDEAWAKISTTVQLCRRQKNGASQGGRRSPSRASIGAEVWRQASRVRSRWSWKAELFRTSTSRASRKLLTMFDSFWVLRAWPRYLSSASSSI